MKAGAPFFTAALFAASAAAHTHATGTVSGAPLPSASSNSTLNDSWSQQNNAKRIQELEDEVKALKAQLQAAGDQCSGGGAAPSGPQPVAPTTPPSRESSKPPTPHAPSAYGGPVFSSAEIPSPAPKQSSAPLTVSTSVPTFVPDHYAPQPIEETCTTTIRIPRLTSSGAGKVPKNTPFPPSSAASYGGNGTNPTYPPGTASGIIGTATGISTSVPSKYPVGPVNSTSGFATGSASRRSSLPTSSATAQLSCASLCSALTRFNDWDVTPMTCTQLTAGTTVKTPTGQSTVGCAANFTTKVDLCQITLDVKTSGTAHTYMEVWLPNGNSSSWNGRTMNTDNGGLNGCVHYVDMAYVSGLGFAAIGDNAGHNGSSFDGTWTMNNNEAIIDWAWRARHASVDVGKQVVNKFYGEKPNYSYYIGCSAGGAQGMQSAQKFPNDFDGIISGAAASDFNHLQDWNAHFYQLTGGPGNDTFLTLAQWIFVQSYILDQCDEKLDGVDDGILEDPTICDFDASAIPACSTGETNSTACLTATQIETVKDVFKPVYNGKNLIYPPLLYGAQVDAFRLGLLAGTPQGIPRDFFRGAVYNDSSFDIAKLSEADYTKADQLDDLHGNPSAFNGDLGAFKAAGKKLLAYHGMADPMTSGYNTQRYYQKVAKTMGLSNTDIDTFMRFFRISGMAHCGVGGISGAGAWQFGQSGAASLATNNIVSNLVDWVEKNKAPETLLGTKFWYDTPSMGIEFERRHCRFPYRTVYKGGDSTKADSWGCEFIDDWQSCEGVTCNTDGTFT